MSLARLLSAIYVIGAVVDLQQHRRSRHSASTTPPAVLFPSITVISGALRSVVVSINSSQQQPFPRKLTDTTTGHVPPTRRNGLSTLRKSIESLGKKPSSKVKRMASGNLHQDSVEGGAIADADHPCVMRATARPRPPRAKHACDKCFSSRTRCIGNGKSTCQHCQDYGFICEYKRERKKRGRAAASRSVTDTTTDDGILDPLEQHDSPSTFDLTTSTVEAGAAYSSRRSTPWSTGSSESIHQHSTSSSAENFRTSFETRSAVSASEQQVPLPFISENASECGSSSTNTSHSRHARTSTLHHPEIVDIETGLHDRGQCYLTNWTNDDQNPSSRVAETNRATSHEQAGQMWNHSCESVSFLPPLSSMLPPVTEGRIVSSKGQLLQSLPFSGVSKIQRSGLPGMISNVKCLSQSELNCRYPVLQPLLPYLRSIISHSLACDLLDLYFTEPSCSLFESASPYVIAPIFRKKSFLCKSKPRKTSPALLVTMIWVAAQTSDSDIFRTPTRMRSRICDSLFELCVSLLSLQDGERSQRKSEQESEIPRDFHSSFEGITYPKSTGAPKSPFSSLDDILTYALIGTVISGSESRKESLRWWTKAWNLAKELNLNREETEEEALESAQKTRELRFTDSSVPHIEDLLAVEESREERRRIWWLLFIADRHLALSYNAPLNILDAECRIYQPLDEATWQDLETKFTNDLPPRFFGPYTTITGSGIFEYFLPLMAILGDIVDIHHLGRHPRLSCINREANVLQVECSLENYATSLTIFEETVLAEFADADPSPSYSPLKSTMSVERPSRASRVCSLEHARLETVIGYSKHILHVLHILLHGSWDPISMLDGADWITPNSFVKCATHAISAANAVESILSFDPELSFMPYLFGIYLLHGSFILLIFADRMDMATSETIIRACETTIRAHEVCVATLNTEYQRTFRKVMRSAVYNARGVMPVDFEQHKARRRDCLSLYQWAEEGKGLAI